MNENNNIKNKQKKIIFKINENNNIKKKIKMNNIVDGNLEKINFFVRKI